MKSPCPNRHRMGTLSRRHGHDITKVYTITTRNIVHHWYFLRFWQIFTIFISSINWLTNTQKYFAYFSKYALNWPKPNSKTHSNAFNIYFDFLIPLKWVWICQSNRQMLNFGWISTFTRQNTHTQTKW